LAPRGLTDFKDGLNFSGHDMLCYRDPIALSVHHMPLCTSFAFFDTGKFLVVDPTQREQMVADGTMVVAMNKHREICLLQMSGSMLLLQEQVELRTS